jgi:hypothetical protein
MDTRLDFLLKRHNVQLKLNQDIQRPAYITKLPTHAELAIQFGVHGAELNEVVAIQLARLMLGQLDQLNKSGDAKLAEWREAVLTASKLLIPDEAVDEAVADGWDVPALAERCHVTELLAQVRLEERLFQRDLAPFMTGMGPEALGASWEELLRALQDRLG